MYFGDCNTFILLCSRSFKTKREFQQVAIDNSSDIVSKNFMKLYKKCPDKAYPFFVLDTTLPLGHILFF